MRYFSKKFLMLFGRAAVMMMICPFLHLFELTFVGAFLYRALNNRYTTLD
jgi:hypothetical protein